MMGLRIRLLFLLASSIALWCNLCYGNKASRLQGQVKSIANSKNVLNPQIDLFFLVDSSGSVGSANFLTIQVFIKNILKHFAIGPAYNRVSVVRFSTDANLVLDYISSPTNKCRFLAELITKLTYNGGWTNTNKGFTLVRQQILKSYNTRKIPKKHKKVVIYITDGNFNKGGDPQGVINSIKNLADVMIFSFGIGNVDENHLRQTATQSTWFYKINTWSEWKEFARLVKGKNSKEVLYVGYGVTRNNCNSGTSGTCDASATCLCGTLTGTYDCRCKEGHYGHGHVNGCNACNRGQYRGDNELATKCTSCPTKATTKTVASTALSQCFCIDGYDGRPNIGQDCILMECDQLSVPKNARFLNPVSGTTDKCPNKFNEECKIKCNEGYRLDSGALYRKCILEKIIENGLEKSRRVKWTESHPTCQKIFCDELATPHRATKTCTNNNLYGSACTFACDQGYTKDAGSQSRKCLATGKWDGQEFSCKPITCDQLPKVTNAQIEDRCTSKSVPYGDTGACKYQCNKGYTLEEDSQKDSKILQCYADGDKPKGKWSAKEPTCLDTTGPDITCPFKGTKVIYTKSRQSYGELQLSDVVVTDNSKEKITNITLTSSPKSKKFKNMRLFRLQQRNALPYVVKYIAVDSSGNTNECQFNVEIRDNEPPVVLSCPDDIIIKGLKDNTANVKWDDPEFQDNSRKPLTVHNSRQPGEFGLGIHPVMYSAEDEWGNKAYCKFEVKIQTNKCPFYPPPVNGALACDGWAQGKFCTVQCQNNTEFARKPAKLYVCGFSGRWTLDPPEAKMPWPDCSKTYIPGTTRLGLLYQYYDGTCGNKKTNDQIRQNFIKILKKSVFGRAGACDVAACKAENVKVYCGDLTTAGRRTRRAAKKQLNAHLDISKKMAIELGYADVKEAYNAIRKKMGKVIRDARRMRVRGVNRRTIKADTLGTCDVGGVFNRTSGNCVKCPVGTYWRKVGDELRCDICKQGTFQASEGQTSCNNCPRDTWTLGVNGKDFAACRGFCPRGTYNSDTGLEVCKACPKGYYQNRRRKTKCLPCRSGTTTATIGAKSSADCQPSCPRGFASATGIAPCEPCKVGSYQSLQGKTDCIECPDGQSTVGIAATEKTQCHHINYCESTPCSNNGVCSNVGLTFSCACSSGYTGKQCETRMLMCQEDICLYGGTCVEADGGNFRCICKPGYLGNRCQINDDECKQNPCMNGATCVDGINDVSCACLGGFMGKFCEENINDCKVDSCLNGGTCVDLLGEVECVCTPAYTGANCSIPVLQCSSDPCQNSARCIEVPGKSPRCICKTGYGGTFCEFARDDCASGPCGKLGRCDDKEIGYKCYCDPGLSGKRCQKKPSSNFKLVFPTSFTQNYATLDRVEEMYELTIAFWMKMKIQKPLQPLQRKTVISYAVKGSTSAFQVMIDDVNGFVLDIGSKEQISVSEVPDDNWHFYALTWTTVGGSWSIYIDGARKDTGKGLKAGTTIPRGGIIVLGQTQDEPGDGFDSREAFSGELYNLNVWSYAMQPSVTSRLQTEAKVGYTIGWPDFRGKQKGNVRLEELTSCSGKTCPNTQFCETSISNGAPVCQNPHDGCKSLPCKNGGTCHKRQGYFTCDCPSNYNGTLCEQAVKCRVPADPKYGRISHKCVETNRLVPANCVVQVVCNSGYEVTSGNGHLRCGGKRGEYDQRIPQCKDIDECSRGLCSHHCVNMFGSYKCSCPPGMKLGTNKRTCQDVNECIELLKRPNGGCSHTCHNTNGNFKCSCRKGYQPTASGFGCKDINECANNNGQCQQKCVNNPGSYKCTCNHGYNLVGKKCIGMSCPEPRTVLGGTFQVGSRQVNGFVSYSCTSPRILVGQDRRKCQPDSKWDGSRPTCIAPSFCHKGCNGGTLNSQTPRYVDVKSNSVAKCGNACSSSGFTYFALANGSACLCGNGYDRQKTVGLALCNKPCTAGDGNKCGGNTSKDIYQIGASC